MGRRAGVFFLLGMLLLAKAVASSPPQPLTPHDKKPLPSNFYFRAAFNGALEIGAFLANLAERTSVATAFETGTYLGYTTLFLSCFFDRVFTVEIDHVRFLQIKPRLEPYPNITAYEGHSVKVLHEALPSLKGESVLFYLDAHWLEDWPLLGELEEISHTHKDNCIIVIDDFKVPSHPEIGYHSSKTDDCSFEYIAAKLDQIFTDYVSFYLVPQSPDQRAKFLAYPAAWDAR